MDDFGHQAMTAWSEIRFKEPVIELVHAVGINISKEADTELFKKLTGVIDDIHGL
jgi:hypothetical protein